MHTRCWREKRCFSGLSARTRGARPVPGSKDARRPLENEMNADGVVIEQDQWERAEYRKHDGLFQYVANDRFDSEVRGQGSATRRGTANNG